MDRGEDAWSRFRGDLPGYVLIWAAVTVIALMLQRIDGRGTTNPVDIVLAMAIIGVALVPLLWLRYAISGFASGQHAMRRTFAAVGLGCLWTVVALVIGFFALTLFGIR